MEEDKIKETRIEEARMKGDRIEEEKMEEDRLEEDTRIKVEGGDNSKKFDFRHAHLQGVSQDINQQLLFYCYLILFSKLILPRSNY